MSTAMTPKLPDGITIHADGRILTIKLRHPRQPLTPRAIVYATLCIISGMLSLILLKILITAIAEFGTAFASMG